MEISLNLNNHCILTEIKRQYNRAISEYLKVSNDENLERKIEFFKKVLESIDLISLRGKHPELAGGSTANVKISEDKNGTLSIMIQDHIIFQTKLPTKEDA